MNGTPVASSKREQQSKNAAHMDRSLAFGTEQLF